MVKHSVVVADRFYKDFALLNAWDSNSVYFVVRHKENLKFSTLRKSNSQIIDHILKDEIIELENLDSQKKMQRVSIWNQENEQIIELITNKLEWSANNISHMYRT